MHPLLLTAVVTIGMQLSFFFVAAACKFDLITDFAGGLNFIALAVLSLVDGGHYHTRQIVASAIVIACRAELGLFLLFRVCKRGKDARFDEIREKFFAFLTFWIFQMVWVWGVSMALVFINYDDADPDWEARDTVGATMAILGFLLQVVADFQKYSFRANPDNKGKFCDVGLWKVSRHPNFFGEMLIWWGIFVMATPVFKPSSEDWGWATITSPLLTMVILLFGSGMPSAEGSNLNRFLKTSESADRYYTYRKRTPILIPFVPSLYAMLPQWVKVVLCFEFPFYEPKPQRPSEESLTDAEIGGPRPPPHVAQGK